MAEASFCTHAVVTNAVHGGLHMQSLVCTLFILMLCVVVLQRQALQDFKPRMMQMTEQSKQQMAEARAAASELHAVQLTLQSAQNDAVELEDEERSLQQMADAMQQSIASNSQV